MTRFVCADCGKDRNGNGRVVCRICRPLVFLCWYCADYHDNQHRHEIGPTGHATVPAPLRRAEALKG